MDSKQLFTLVALAAAAGGVYLLMRKAHPVAVQPAARVPQAYLPTAGGTAAGGGNTDAAWITAGGSVAGAVIGELPDLISAFSDN